MTGRNWTKARQRSPIALHGRESINGKERDQAEMARTREIVDLGLKPMALVAGRGLSSSAAYRGVLADLLHRPRLAHENQPG